MIKMLVCEGPCSPATREYDDAIRGNRATAAAMTFSGTTFQREAELADTRTRAMAAAKRLVHTPARRRCVQCGTRKF